MISIITAVHNQLEMNKLFYENLKKNTKNNFELIIIDNNSNDGSREYFQGTEAIVIENSNNYSYPYCQNQGIDKSTGKILFFVNNDIIVSKNWDQRLIDNMNYNKLDVATSCGIERLESISETKKIKRKWKRIKNTISLFGISETTLKLMFRLMYKEWNNFIEERYKKFKNQAIEGFVGNTVAIRRSALEKIGYWDERIQAGDFDLSMRVKKRSLEVGDIKPIHIALDVFNHHYIRLTLKSSYPPFHDKDNLITLEKKWGEEAISEYIKVG